MTSQYPNQQPYGYQAPGYQAPGSAAPSYGAYDAQAAYGYYQQPAFVPPQEPRRPGTATAAGVLGIISGSLGLVLMVMSLFIVLGLHSVADISGHYYDVESFLLLRYGYSASVLLFSLLLLIGGILVLNGKGHALLIVAVLGQVAATIFDLVIAAMAANLVGASRLNRDVLKTLSLNPFTIITAFIGIGLALANLIVALNRSTRAWRN